MTELQQLIENLQDTEGALVHLERAVADRPHDEILKINVESISKRRDDLVRRVDYALHVTQSEICRYSILRDWTDSYPAKAVASSLSTFQDLVTSIFDALRTAPKLRYRPSPENIELSTLNFVGAGAGSVIVTLSLPNERLLVGETALDKTFLLVQKTLVARESGDLNELAKEIGVASISKAYSWADASVAYGLDTEIRWGKSYSDTKELVVTRAAAQDVKSAIENKSTEKEDPVDLDCVLLGFDGTTSYFHVETVGDREDIRGDVGPGVSKIWTTGQAYHARLLKKSQIIYSTGEEKIKWTLVDLQPIDLKSLS